MWKTHSDTRDTVDNSVELVDISAVLRSFPQKEIPLEKMTGRSLWIFQYLVKG